MKSVFVGEFDLLDSHVKSPCFPFTSYRDQFLEYISCTEGSLIHKGYWVYAIGWQDLFKQLSSLQRSTGWVRLWLDI